MKKIELLAPTGNLERLKIAALHGVDAVYLGGKQLSLCSRVSNSGLKETVEGVAFVKEHGAHMYVAVNMLPHEEDLHGLKEYLIELERVGVTAIVAVSPGIMMCAKRWTPKLEVHVSTQHSSTNSSAVDYWQEKGMDHVVLGREVTLEEIKTSTAYTQVPSEALIHGGMCISYSGRCVLSSNMAGRDANRGGCAQGCHWKYRLYEGDRALYDEQDLFSMSSEDLMAAKYIPDLIMAGIASLRIEGCMEGAYYIATLIKTYRMLIDEIYAGGGRLSDKRMEWHYNELAKAENRPTGCGFYEDMPSFRGHSYGVNGAGVTQEFIAYVLDYEEENDMATLEVRSNFHGHIATEASGPTMSATRFKLQELYDMNGNLLDVAKTSMQKIRTHVPLRLEKDAMVCEVVTRNRFGIYQMVCEYVDIRYCGITKVSGIAVLYKGC